MTNEHEQKHAELLKKAENAEAQASRVSDPMLQASWQRIAQNYRGLARSEAVLIQASLGQFRSQSRLAEGKVPPL